MFQTIQTLESYWFWNPNGRLAFPIFLVDNQTMVDKLIHECYEAFNKPHDDGGQPRDWPLCAIELLSHMIAAVDTKTCQRRNDLINIFAPFMLERADKRVKAHGSNGPPCCHGAAGFSRQMLFVVCQALFNGLLNKKWKFCQNLLFWSINAFQSDGRHRC